LLSCAFAAIHDRLLALGIMTNYQKFIKNIKAAFGWGLLDVKCKYRRSVIGPFWETINVSVMIFGITLMSSAVFHAGASADIAYIGLGIIVWYLLTSLITDAMGVFVINKDYIRNSSMSIDMYVWRTIFRILIAFCHHLILYVFGVIWLDIPLHASNLMVFVGFFFLIINSFWAVPTIGFLCARFRDLEMVIRNLLQLTFFITPIFWNYHTVPADRTFIVVWNPFFYFLEAVRAPLLGETLPANFYLTLTGITVLGYFFMWQVYRSMRRDLAFYV